jgi:hypothetical protein
MAGQQELLHFELGAPPLQWTPLKNIVSPLVEADSLWVDFEFQNRPSAVWFAAWLTKFKGLHATATLHFVRLAASDHGRAVTWWSDLSDYQEWDNFRKWCLTELA